MKKIILSLLIVAGLASCETSNVPTQESYSRIEIIQDNEVIQDFTVFDITVDFNSPDVSSVSENGVIFLNDPFTGEQTIAGGGMYMFTDFGLTRTTYSYTDEIIFSGYGYILNEATEIWEWREFKIYQTDDPNYDPSKKVTINIYK